MTSKLKRKIREAEQRYQHYQRSRYLDKEKDKADLQNVMFDIADASRKGK